MDDTLVEEFSKEIDRVVDRYLDIPAALMASLFRKWAEELDEVAEEDMEMGR